ncbi:NAD(P)/FAD-dependent oxidoreductase [Desulfobulbus rhabdoformis]|uniref:NAD(P)/FAD-dependent oxidoreductase n=1 Tax=Desulfobulbus rhabdoformis TaxID=34032 RepID=UPI001962B01C|nr:NAD(P)/FAD-dependent oxidoreductase [Desulfobulbus rhabdoformis]MBM9612676.1 NAD(P)/FAD-dependent oxidoreductase [Desulfobulbus rhabdoformis]
MLKDGEQGVIRQRGIEKISYAIAPHVPCGLITPDQLRAMADVAEKYNIAELKITSAARIALIGLNEEEVEQAWKDLGMDPGHAVGLCVRSVKACPGIQYCRLAQQDSLEMGMELDRRYNGMALPSKMKIGVSGCKIQCAENCIKDVSLYGTPKGWSVMIGGCGSAWPRLADLLVEDLPTKEALDMFARIMDYYKENSKRERVGRMIERIGFDKVKTDILG